MRWNVCSSHLTRSGFMRSIVALLLGLVLVAAASAHVTVNPQVVPANTFASFTVRVPTEKDEPTVKLRVEFPAQLIVSRFQPKPGWNRDVEKDASGRIVAATWSGGEIGADEYEEFTFLGRTPKEPGRLAFKAYQTYGGGETVAWAGEEGSEAPAPLVEVQPAASLAMTAEATVETDEQHAPVANVTVEAAPDATTVAPSVTENVPSAAAEESFETAISIAGSGDSGVASASAGANASGSDLPLFTSLAALVVGVIALGLSMVSLGRRRGSA